MKKRLISILLTLVMLIGLLPTMAFADGGYTVTLYADDGKGTQQLIENVSGTYVLPECPFEAPAGKTFYRWAIGSGLGEQKVPGAAINVTKDTLVVAIWDESDSKYTKRPDGGITSVNGTFTISYKLSVQPISMWLQFYNDYQGKWSDNFCMATLPESLGAYTETEVPCIHSDTEETVKWRLVAYLSGMAYYSNVFEVEYVNRVFTMQPQSQSVAYNTDVIVNYELNFKPETIFVERYVESFQYGNYWTYISSADATYAELTGYDSDVTNTYRIAANSDKGTIYSNPFTVSWTSGFTISFDANGGSGSMSTVNNQIGQYTLPACTFTAPEGKVFSGWATTSNGDVISSATINVKENTTLYAIWKNSFTLQPTGGTTVTNGTFTISYSLGVQPDTIYLQFYNDYQGKWTDNYCLATMPEGVGMITYMDVPTVHKDTVETILWRIVAYVNDVPYYSNEFSVVYEKAPAQEYLVCYYPGEASGSPDVYILEEGTQHTLAPCMFEAPSGKQFKTWVVGSLSGEQKQPGEQITITGETYIYAIWEYAQSAITVVAVYDEAFDLEGKVVVEVKHIAGNAEKKITVNGAELYYSVQRDLHVGLVDASAVSGDTLTGSVTTDEEPTIFVYGNVDGDYDFEYIEEAIDSSDLQALKRALKGQKTLTGADLIAADLDGDGISDSSDLQALKQFLKTSKVFPILK